MDFEIPLFDLNYDDAEIEAVVSTLRSRWISMGPRTGEFEQRFATLLGTSHAVGVASGTAALHLALRVLGVADGDEVIVPSLTFVATVSCIRYVNARPAFCDIRAIGDLTIDPGEIEKCITEKTKAIIVMHYGGFPCDMEAIVDLARKHGLYVIEDAAHAPMSEYGGRKLGTIGDVGCFSFFSNKNVCMGEGGMLVTGSHELFEQAKLLRSHGMTTLSYQRAQGHATNYDVVDIGYNYRLDDLRASIGLAQLDKLEDDLKRRAELRDRYIEQLSSVEEICVPFVGRGDFVTNYIFPVILRPQSAHCRETVRMRLAESGVQTSVHYPAVHRFSMFQEYESNLPTTEYVSDNVITLPMYGTLRHDQVDLVVARLKKALHEDRDSHR